MRQLKRDTIKEYAKALYREFGDTFIPLPAIQETLKYKSRTSLYNYVVKPMITFGFANKPFRGVIKINPVTLID